MGLFRRLFGSNPPPALTPDELRARLFAAAAAGDDLEAFCRAHQPAITAAFPAWATLPPEVRSDPAAVQHHGAGLVAVARCFAERLGDPSLLARLVGPPEHNALLRWQESLARARALMRELKYDEASALLGDTLVAVRGLQGSGVDELMPVTLGELGACRFHGGRPADAIPLLEDALARCERLGEPDGVLAYLANLFEVHRWLGRRPETLAYARRIAAALDAGGRGADARRYHAYAARFPDGEPLCRVVAVIDGRPHELDELPPAVGRVQFMFERDRITLRPAVVYSERGAALGARGDHAGALVQFRLAAAADPHDPQSRYELAFSLLHLRRHAEAAAAYAEVERLAPGWFRSRADRWLAERIARGELSHDAFLAVHAVQDGPLPPAEKLAIADTALAEAPHFALLHLLRARELARLGRAHEALQALRDGLACDPEPDTRARLLVELGATAGDPVERDALLTAAQAPGGNLVSAAMARLLQRSAPRPA
ncbi:MAG: hypothetical protein JNL82_21770 [Myxococcales bacterium]|nr:hypothetical protein [Myxococcales bacterium]